MSIHDRFEAVNDDYLKFDRVKEKRSSRPDLHAFLLLDEIFTAPRDIIQAAEHDEIFLDINEEQASKLTDDQILELVRCGVRYSECDCLCMFV
jgi:hypothetical protein